MIRARDGRSWPDADEAYAVVVPDGRRRPEPDRLDVAALLRAVANASRAFTRLADDLNRAIVAVGAAARPVLAAFEAVSGRHAP